VRDLSVEGAFRKAVQNLFDQTKALIDLVRADPNAGVDVAFVNTGTSNVSSS